MTEPMFLLEDLPLFSGTAVRVKEQVYQPEADEGEQDAFAECRACMDTGWIGDKRCPCGAGREEAE